MGQDLLQKSEKSFTRMIKNYLNKKYSDFGFSWVTTEHTE